MVKKLLLVSLLVLATFFTGCFGEKKEADKATEKLTRIAQDYKNVTIKKVNGVLVDGIYVVKAPGDIAFVALATLSDTGFNSGTFVRDEMIGHYPTSYVVYGGKYVLYNSYTGLPAITTANQTAIGTVVATANTAVKAYIVVGGVMTTENRQADGDIVDANAKYELRITATQGAFALLADGNLSSGGPVLVSPFGTVPVDISIEIIDKITGERVSSSAVDAGVTVTYELTTSPTGKGNVNNAAPAGLVTEAVLMKFAPAQITVQSTVTINIKVKAATRNSDKTQVNEFTEIVAANLIIKMAPLAEGVFLTQTDRIKIILAAPLTPEEMTAINDTTPNDDNKGPQYVNRLIKVFDNYYSEPWRDGKPIKIRKAKTLSTTEIMVYLDGDYYEGLRRDNLRNNPNPAYIFNDNYDENAWEYNFPLTDNTYGVLWYNFSAAKNTAGLLFVIEDSVPIAYQQVKGKAPSFTTSGAIDKFGPYTDENGLPVYVKGLRNLAGDLVQFASDVTDDLMPNQIKVIFSESVNDTYPEQWYLDEGNYTAIEAARLGAGYEYSVRNLRNWTIDGITLGTNSNAALAGNLGDIRIDVLKHTYTSPTAFGMDEDERSTVIITFLNPLDQAAFTATLNEKVKVHSLALAKIGDWASVTDKNNIISGQTKKYTSYYMEAIPEEVQSSGIEFVVYKESPEQFLVKFPRQVVDTIGTVVHTTQPSIIGDGDIQDNFAIEYFPGNAAPGLQLTVANGGIKVTELQAGFWYLLEVTNDWTHIYDTVDAFSTFNYFNRGLGLFTFDLIGNIKVIVNEFVYVDGNTNEYDNAEFLRSIEEDAVDNPIPTTQFSFDQSIGSPYIPATTSGNATTFDGNAYKYRILTKERGGEAENEYDSQYQYYNPVTGIDDGGTVDAGVVYVEFNEPIQFFGNGQYGGALVNPLTSSELQEDTFGNSGIDSALANGARYFEYVQVGKRGQGNKVVPGRVVEIVPTFTDPRGWGAPVNAERDYSFIVAPTQPLTSYDSIDLEGDIQGVGGTSWKLVVRGISDDVGNEMKTQAIQFDITNSKFVMDLAVTTIIAHRNVAYWLKNDDGTTFELDKKNTDDTPRTYDIIHVLYNGYMNQDDVKNVDNYTIANKPLPAGAKIETGIRFGRPDYDSNYDLTDAGLARSPLQAVTIVLEDGWLDKNGILEENINGNGDLVQGSGTLEFKSIRGTAPRTPYVTKAITGVKRPITWATAFHDYGGNAEALTGTRDYYNLTTDEIYGPNGRVIITGAQLIPAIGKNGFALTATTTTASGFLTMGAITPYISTYTGIYTDYQVRVQYTTAILYYTRSYNQFTYVDLPVTELYYDANNKNNTVVEFDLPYTTTINNRYTYDDTDVRMLLSNVLNAYLTVSNLKTAVKRDLNDPANMAAALAAYANVSYQGLNSIQEAALRAEVAGYRAKLFTVTLTVTPAAVTTTISAVITGRATTGATVTLTGAVIAGTTTADAITGLYSITVSALTPNTTYTGVITASKTGYTTTSVAVSVTTQPLPVVALTTTVPAVTITTQSAVISGTVTTGATVTITGAGITVGTTTTAAGVYAFNLTTLALSTQYTVTVTAILAGYTTSTAVVTFTTKALTPTALVVSSSITATTSTAVITGTAITGATITVTGAGITTVTTVAATGIWSVTVLGLTPYTTYPGVSVIATMTQCSTETAIIILATQALPIVALTATAPAITVTTSTAVISGTVTTAATVSITGVGITVVTSTNALGVYSFTLNTLALSTTYSVTVTAILAGYTSSTAVATFTTKALTPTALAVSSITASTSSAVIAGTAITGATITVTGAGITTITQIATAGAFSITVSALTPATTTTVSITATMTGCSTETAIRTITTTALSVAAVTVSPTAVTVTSKSAVISGTATTGATVTVSGPGITAVTTVAAAGVYTVTISALTSNTTYTGITVQASLAGWATSSAVTVADFKTANLDAVVVTTTGVTVTTDTAVIAGTVTTGATVKLINTSTGAVQSLVSADGTFSITATALTYNTTYSVFTVEAKKAGYLTTTVTVAAFKTTDYPTTVTAITPTLVTTSTAVITGTATTDATITITNTSNGAVWTTTTAIGTTAYAITITGITPGTTYTAIKVTASKTGMSSSSVTLGAFTTTALSTAAINSNTVSPAAITSSTAVIYGTATTDATITVRNTSNGAVWTTTTAIGTTAYAITITGLTPSTTYSGITIEASLTGWTTSTAVTVSAFSTTLAAITQTKIHGLEAPVADALPVDVIVADAQFTGKVAWSGTFNVNGTFKSGCTYTAAVILTPKTGYTVTGITANQFTLGDQTGTTTSITNPVNTGTITVIFVGI